MKRLIFILTIVILSAKTIYAQSDPVLTGMIIAYTDKAEKQLKSQEKTMLLQTTGHIWTKRKSRLRLIFNDSSTTTLTVSALSSVTSHRYMGFTMRLAS